MSDNVGLSTPRGSGTSGFVQRNRAFVQPRDAYRQGNPRDYLDGGDDKSRTRNRLRQPDQGILDHDQKRVVELRVFELRDQLEEKEVDEDEIERQCDELRQRLTAAARTPSQDQNQNQPREDGRRRFKAHQVHEQARAKIEESERLRRALRISKDYEEGGHWRRQEEKQALKRKKDEEKEEASAQDARRKRASSADRAGSPPSRSVSRSVSRSRSRSPSPPLPSVEVDRDNGRGHNGYDSDRSNHSDHSDRGRDVGRRVRQRRDSSPGGGRGGSRSPSQSRSRSRSRSPSRSPSRGRRSRSYSSRSRSRSQD